MFVSDQNDTAPEIVLPPQISRSVAQRRAEFVSGRLCARDALKTLGATYLDIPIGADRSPIWPSGFVGSITHSNGMAFAAVARASQAQSLGLDVEKIMPRDTACELGPILATSAEYNRLLTSPWDHPLLVTSVFSAKETIFKCLYPVIKRQFDFMDVEMTSLDASNGTFSFSLSAELSKVFPDATNHIGRMAFVDGLVHTGLVLSKS
jgi:enterobactin synthetase component D